MTTTGKIGIGIGIAKKGLGMLGKALSKSKSDYRLKNTLKKIQKTPDKKFKSHNPATEKVKSDRTGKIHDVQKTNPVKGSRGKKKYIQDWKKGHQAHKRMGLIKD